MVSQKVKNLKNIFHRSFVIYFLLAILVEALMIVVCRGTISTLLHTLYEKYMADTGFSVYDVFYAQISTTFILISIISLLSTNTQKVYWDDMMHRKLIKPIFLNFTSLTAYLLASLLVSSYFYCVGSNYMLLSFAISLVLMSVFTVKMVGAYFGRESVRAEMEKEFRKLTVEEQTDYRKALMEASLTAIDNNEMGVLVENMQLLLPVIANDDDEIDIYTNAVMNKIIVEKNAFALFSVLSQNDVLWISLNSPFNKYFCALSSWQGGFYYQKVLLDGYVNNTIFKAGGDDRTPGLRQAFNACFEVMYIEMSREFGLENADQIMQMMKQWVAAVRKKGMILTEGDIKRIEEGKVKKPDSYILGPVLTDFLMDFESEGGGLFVLIEMIKGCIELKEFRPEQLSVMLFMYSYIICMLESDISDKNQRKNRKMIKAIIKENVPEYEEG